MFAKIPRRISFCGICGISHRNSEIPWAFTEAGRRIRDTALITQKGITIFKG